MNKELYKPKNTFSNLSAGKQGKIAAAFLEEFATKGYQKASLNTVVHNIGIAKGSLYQYFDNKEGIFLFIFDQFTRKVKKLVGNPQEHAESHVNFWDAVSNVLWAGITFIDKYPKYYQFYLNVLFEQDVPRREELIARVRLFSLEYFGPKVTEEQADGRFTAGVPARMIVFLIDAAIDSFLQAYARSYLDGGLGLAGRSKDLLASEIDSMLLLLRRGIENNAGNN